MTGEISPASQTTKVLYHYPPNGPISISSLNQIVRIEYADRRFGRIPAASAPQIAPAKNLLDSVS